MGSKIKLVGLGLLSILTLGFLVKKGADVVSQTDDIAQKFIFDFGSFRIHNVSLSGIVLAIDGIKIYNQSNFTATIQNLYVNVRYLSGATPSNLLIQDNFLNPVTITANSATILPSILFKLTLSNLVVLYQMYKKTISDKLLINVRFQVLGGYEISLDSEQTLAPQFAMLKKLFDNSIVQTLLGNGPTGNRSGGAGNVNFQQAVDANKMLSLTGNIDNSLFKA